MIRASYLTLFLALIFHPALTMAHGTLGTIEKGRGIIVSADYDDGEPMAYTEVTVYFNDQGLPYQTGRTDRNGRFMIFPESPGTYKAEIRDPMGHGLTLTTQIDDSLETLPRASGMPASSKTLGALTGVNLILLLTGIGVWIRKKLAPKASQG